MSYSGKGKLKTKNIHPLLDDSLIYFYRSKNDYHLGLPDYLYYKLLGIDPVTYYNIMDIEVRAFELELEEEDFNKYENQLPVEIKASISKFIERFKERYDFENNAMFTKTPYGDFWIPTSEKYCSKLIVKEIFNYTKER